ncbi:MAG TPA: TerB family tellurite resistance protein [Polyangia bacterium]|nr:TerB family tellurite resistance protein [Polyangia bacterium]
MALKDQPDRLPLVADLLMDAAYADDRLEGEEKAAVKRMLREILDAPALPMDLDFRIDEFDPKRFDRAATVAAFAADSKDLKQRLLELVAAVHASDGEIDFAEDAQLREVGAGLGLAPEDFQDLVVEVVEEIDLGEDLVRLRYGD